MPITEEDEVEREVPTTTYDDPKRIIPGTNMPLGLADELARRLSEQEDETTVHLISSTDTIPKERSLYSLSSKNHSYSFSIKKEEDSYQEKKSKHHFMEPCGKKVKRKTGVIEKCNSVEIVCLDVNSLLNLGELQMENPESDEKAGKIAKKIKEFAKVYKEANK
ncbi:hypothetical protein L1987_08797 [Smallanthus sonchifolius]|uniref:Uncharacterized protein n=1 Tax=Smallanthus sonchifolius TaxID=185202 RepID=A0ACB9JLP9_9ASTR|nr:hypothetical protein L1987_08797 [Smallanthus sonchifolius]